MRRGTRLILAVSTLITLCAGVVPAAPVVGASSSSSSSSSSSTSTSSSSSSSSPDATAGLRAQRAALVAQLNSLQGPRAEAKAQLLAAESALTAVEQRLADARTTLDAVNASLKDLAARIDADERDLSRARTELAGLLRTTYEASDRDGFAGAVLSANNFSDAMDRVRGAQQVTARLGQLQQDVTRKEADLLHERSDLQAKGTQAQQLEADLNAESGRLVASVAARDEAFKAIDGPAREIASRIAGIDDQLAPPAPPPLAVGAAGPVTSSSPCGNRFAYGYCTYYVATRRCIPWLGNAWEWWGNARAYGYAEGQVPERGAVVVWGRSGSSPDGHVAYVEAVGPDGGVPDGSFLISEMNYAGWNRVNYRTVRVGAPGILGFIYGRA